VPKFTVTAKINPLMIITKRNKAVCDLFFKQTPITFIVVFVFKGFVTHPLMFLGILNGFQTF